MWLAESCFDGEREAFRKFLLPGNEYHFGRKAPADLILADKTVSKESAILFVDKFLSSDDGVEGPSLKIRALKRAIRIIPESSEREWKQDRDNFIGVNVDPDKEKELQSGDTIILTKSAPAVKFIWVPLVFSAAARIKQEEVDERKQLCNKVGIRLEKSRQLVSGTTHLLSASKNVLTIPIMHAAALAVPIVTIGYLDELIRRAMLGKEDEESLQKHYILPSAERYFPEEVEVEGMTRKEAKSCLAPNDARKTLFVGTTVLLLHDERGLQKSAEQLSPICKSSGARIMEADISRHGDDEAVLRLLRRSKSEAETLLAEHGEAASEAPDDGLVVICDMEDSNTAWYQRVVRLTRQLRIAMPKLGFVALSKALLYADARQFLNTIFEDEISTQMMEETQATTLPPTMPESREAVNANHITAPIDPTPIAPTQQDRPSRSTPPPTPQVQSTATKSPRRPKRRADMARRDPLEDIFGISAPSTSLVPTASDATIPATAEGTEADHMQQPSARMRRHAAGDSKRPRISEAYRSLFGNDVTEHESQMTETGNEATTTSFPLTRKYREELDEADRLESQRESQMQMGREEVTEPSQNSVMEKHGGRKRRSRELPEMESQTPRQRLRREASAMSEAVDTNEEIGVDGDMEAGEETITAYTAEEDKELNMRDPESNEDGLLLKEKPARVNDDKGADTDDKFLQAMATSKKSKKPLDQFDKEFNLLRITKPNHRTGHHGRIIADVDDPEYRAWEQMTASDFDINAAGNFVQIDFVPLVYQRSEQEEKERQERQKRAQIVWHGQPNFKKFKAKQKTHRAPVVVDIHIGQDYGLGDTYIRPTGGGGRSVGLDGDDDDGVEGVQLMAPVENDLMTRRRASGDITLLSDDEDESLGATPLKRATQRGSNKSLQSRESAEKDAESDNDEIMTKSKRRVDMRLGIDADLDDSTITSRRHTPSHTSQRPASTMSGSKRSTINISSDEDEISSTFSGFRKKRRI